MEVAQPTAASQQQQQVGAAGGTALAQTDESRSTHRHSSHRCASGRWEKFNEWCQSEFERTKAKPKKELVIRWYEDNAHTAWSDKDRPTLKEVRAHAKDYRTKEEARSKIKVYRANKRRERALTQSVEAASAAHAVALPPAPGLNAVPAPNSSMLGVVPIGGSWSMPGAFPGYFRPPAPAPAPAPCIPDSPGERRRSSSGGGASSADSSKRQRLHSGGGSGSFYTHQTTGEDDDEGSGSGDACTTSSSSGGSQLDTACGTQAVSAGQCDHDMTENSNSASAAQSECVADGAAAARGLEVGVISTGRQAVAEAAPAAAGGRPKPALGLMPPDVCAGTVDEDQALPQQPAMCRECHMHEPLGEDSMQLPDYLQPCLHNDQLAAEPLVHQLPPAAGSPPPEPQLQPAAGSPPPVHQLQPAAGSPPPATASPSVPLDAAATSTTSTSCTGATQASHGPLHGPPAAPAAGGAEAAAPVTCAGMTPTGSHADEGCGGSESSSGKSTLLALPCSAPLALPPVTTGVPHLMPSQEVTTGAEMPLTPSAYFDYARMWKAAAPVTDANDGSPPLNVFKTAALALAPSTTPNEGSGSGLLLSSGHISPITSNSLRQQSSNIITTGNSIERSLPPLLAAGSSKPLPLAGTTSAKPLPPAPLAGRLLPLGGSCPVPGAGHLNLPALNMGTLMGQTTFPTVQTPTKISPKAPGLTGQSAIGQQQPAGEAQGSGHAEKPAAAMDVAKPSAGAGAKRKKVVATKKQQPAAAAGPAAGAAAANGQQQAAQLPRTGGAGGCSGEQMSGCAQHNPVVQTAPQAEVGGMPAHAPVVSLLQLQHAQQQQQGLQEVTRPEGDGEAAELADDAISSCGNKDTYSHDTGMHASMQSQQQQQPMGMSMCMGQQPAMHQYSYMSPQQVNPTGMYQTAVQPYAHPGSQPQQTPMHGMQQSMYGCYAQPMMSPGGMPMTSMPQVGMTMQHGMAAGHGCQPMMACQSADQMAGGMYGMPRAPTPVMMAHVPQGSNAAPVGPLNGQGQQSMHGDGMMPAAVRGYSSMDGSLPQQYSQTQQFVVSTGAAPQAQWVPRPQYQSSAGVAHSDALQAAVAGSPYGQMAGGMPMQAAAYQQQQQGFLEAQPQQQAQQLQAAMHDLHVTGGLQLPEAQASRSTPAPTAGAASMGHCNAQGGATMPHAISEQHDSNGGAAPGLPPVAGPGTSTCSAINVPRPRHTAQHNSETPGCNVTASYWDDVEQRPGYFASPPSSIRSKGIFTPPNVGSPMVQSFDWASSAISSGSQLSQQQPSCGMATSQPAAHMATATSNMQGPGHFAPAPVNVAAGVSAPGTAGGMAMQGGCNWSYSSAPMAATLAPSHAQHQQQQIQSHTQHSMPFMAAPAQVPAMQYGAVQQQQPATFWQQPGCHTATVATPSLEQHHQQHPHQSMYAAMPPQQVPAAAVSYTHMAPPANGPAPCPAAHAPAPGTGYPAYLQPQQQQQQPASQVARNSMLQQQQTTASYPSPLPPMQGPAAACECAQCQRPGALPLQPQQQHLQQPMAAPVAAVPQQPQQQLQGAADTYGYAVQRPQQQHPPDPSSGQGLRRPLHALPANGHAAQPAVAEPQAASRGPVPPSTSQHLNLPPLRTKSLQDGVGVSSSCCYSQVPDGAAAHGHGMPAVLQQPQQQAATLAAGYSYAPMQQHTAAVPAATLHHHQPMQQHQPGMLEAGAMPSAGTNGHMAMAPSGSQPLVAGMAACMHTQPQAPHVMGPCGVRGMLPTQQQQLVQSACISGRHEAEQAAAAASSAVHNALGGVAAAGGPMRSASMPHSIPTPRAAGHSSMASMVQPQPHTAAPVPTVLQPATTAPMAMAAPPAQVHPPQQPLVQHGQQQQHQPVVFTRAGSATAAPMIDEDAMWAEDPLPMWHRRSWGNLLSQ